MESKPSTTTPSAPAIAAAGLKLTPYGTFPSENSFSDNGRMLRFNYDMALSAKEVQDLNTTVPRCDVFRAEDGRLFSYAGATDFFLQPVRAERYAEIVPLPPTPEPIIADAIGIRKSIEQQEAAFVHEHSIETADKAADAYLPAAKEESTTQSIPPTA